MKKSLKYKIGIDEAGRGPWLGPVVACALCFAPNNLPNKKFLEKITDSKKLSEKKREKIFKELIEFSIGENPKVFFGVGVVDNFTIDEINIKQANKEAMNRALFELERKIDFKKLESISIDGNDNYEFKLKVKSGKLKESASHNPVLPIKPTFVIKGDEKILEIGAASIIAKVFRDKLISQYSLLYPDLGIEKHKGYGTKKHKEHLTNKSKITGIHRLSYKPVKEILEK